MAGRSVLPPISFAGTVRSGGRIVAVTIAYCTVRVGPASGGCSIGAIVRPHWQYWATWLHGTFLWRRIVAVCACERQSVDGGEPGTDSGPIGMMSALPMSGASGEV